MNIRLVKVASLVLSIALCFSSMMLPKLDVNASEYVQAENECVLGSDEVRPETINHSIDEFISDSRWCDGIFWPGDMTPKTEPLARWYGCAAYCYDYVMFCYGLQNPRSGTAFTDINEIRTGDVVTIGNQSNGAGHWFVVVKRDGDRLYVAEGNYGSKVRIGWNYTISGSKFAESSNPFNTGYHYLAADQLPIGCWDFCEARDGRLYIQGWAFDPDNSSASVAIHVYAGMTGLGTLIADREGEDVNRAYGITGRHRFAEYFDISADGTYDISIFAINLVDETQHTRLSHTPGVQGNPVRVVITHPAPTPVPPTNTPVPPVNTPTPTNTPIPTEVPPPTPTKKTSPAPTKKVSLTPTKQVTPTKKATPTPVQKPGIPMNVKAVSASVTSVNVSWSAVSEADGYQVWRSTQKDSGFVVLGSVTTTSRVSTGLKTGTTYYYRVRAYKNVDGNKVYGGYSTVVDAVPKPVAPSNVEAVPETTTSIKVSWNAVTGATGYQVWRSTSATGTFTAIGSVTETSRASISLKTGTTYYYKVRAYKEMNGTKVYSAFSSVVSCMTKPSVPTGVKATVSSATKVTVSWNAVAGATGYDVYRATSADGTYSKLGSVTTTSRACPGLTTGTKYYFKVRAYVEINGRKYYSNYSSVVNATPKK